MRLRSFFSSLCGKARDFARNHRANTAMMFGLSLVPLMVATGAGIDFARGVMVHQRMAAALDSAALAVGNATSKPSSCSADSSSGSNNACYALRQTAQEYFDMNYDHSKDTSYGVPNKVTISISGQAVTLNATLPLKLTLMGISALDIGTPNVAASSTVVWGQTKLWVALVLDNSGSMSKGDSGGTKMAALQDAITNSTYGLLGTLQAAAASAGDVKVGIVPFTRSINPGLASSSTYIDWGEWEAPPINAGTLSTSLGPGGSCPWSTGSNGFKCASTTSNGSSTTSSIPSSGTYKGYICPSLDNGDFNTAHRDRYYNGCWDSVATQTKTVTQTDTTPVTTSQNCTQKNSGTITCTNRSGYPDDGHTSSSSVTVVTNGYTGDSVSTSSNTVTDSTTNGSKDCTTSHSNTTCTWRRTIEQTRTDKTITKTANAYTHTWRVNSHSTWTGCVMDRQQKNKQTTLNGGTGYRTAAAYDYDETNTQPASNGSVWDDTQFPAENNTGCDSNTAAVTTLNYDWTTLASKVNAMKADGNTNQGIGIAHGWQLLTTGAPYGTGSLPAGTTKVIILFSDGLNTQDRWYGDGLTEGTTEDGYIDTRMKAACAAAKADQVTVYAIFVHIGTNGSSDALEKCASDTSKYYDLTSSASIKTAFSDIAQKITNLRVSQ